jgi:sugar transferase (PEP-CTERM/EpsH1 system associated)
MKILYLAHRIPYPPNKGDKIRSFNEIKYLAKNHSIDLICLADDPNDLQHKEDLQKYCRKVFVYPISTTWSKIKGLAEFCIGKPITTAYFYRKTVQETFNHWLTNNDYDAVICFSSSMAEYVFKSVQLYLIGQGRGPEKPKLIMDFCDIDSDKWLQYAQKEAFPLKQVYQAENFRLQAYETQVYKTFDASTVASQKEKELFLQVCPAAENMVVLPNGVDTEYFSPQSTQPAEQLTDESALVFTGAMDYHANVDGVCWFCEHIFPAVRKQYENARFYIVGRNPAPAVEKLGTLPGVHVIGNVADIRPWYQKAAVFVVPMRLGRGVQNKVLEAMAMGRPIVSTSKANDGIGALDGEHLIIADSADNFARAVTGLLQDHNRQKILGVNARNFVLAENTWEEHMARLENLLT